MDQEVFQRLLAALRGELWDLAEPEGEYVKEAHAFRDVGSGVVEEIAPAPRPPGADEAEDDPARPHVVARFGSQNR